MFNDIHDRFNYIPYSHYRYVDVVNNIHIRAVPQLLHAFLPIDGRLKPLEVYTELCADTTHWLGGRSVSSL